MRGEPGPDTYTGKEQTRLLPWAYPPRSQPLRLRAWDQQYNSSRNYATLEENAEGGDSDGFPTVPDQGETVLRPLRLVRSCERVGFYVA